MQAFDTLTILWEAYCAQRGVDCRDALEMACDESLPRDVRHMAAQFVVLWESVENENP